MFIRSVICFVLFFSVGTYRRMRKAMADGLARAAMPGWVPATTPQARRRQALEASLNRKAEASAAAAAALAGGHPNGTPGFGSSECAWKLGTGVVRLLIFNISAFAPPLL